MKDVVTAEPVVVVEVECKCVLAGRGDEATDGQEHRNPAANEQHEAVFPPSLSLSRTARPDEFDAPPKIEPGGDGSNDLVYLELRAAAAAHEVERAGHDYCENDENHVEHRVPFGG